MSLKAEFKRGQKNLGLKRKRRRELDITLPNMLRTLADLKRKGRLKGLTKSEKAERLATQLRMDRPQAMDAQLAFDSEFWAKFLAFIKFILPFLLMCI